MPQNINFAIKSGNVRSFLEANHIDYETAQSTNKLDPADVGESAAKSVVMLECLNSAGLTRGPEFCPARVLRAMVSIYVGVTDGDWFRFLAQRPDIREVNFWQPVDTEALRGTDSLGNCSCSSLKSPRITSVAGGGGLYVSANAYPTSLALGGVR